MKNSSWEDVFSANQTAHTISKNQCQYIETSRNGQFKKLQEQFQLVEFQDKKKSTFLTTLLIQPDQETKLKLRASSSISLIMAQT
jgi:bifunctional DNase/RNase